MRNFTLTTGFARARLALALLAGGLLLPSCGGGGGYSAPSAPATTAAPTTTTTVATTTTTSVATGIDAAILAATPTMANTPMNTIVTQKLLPQIEVFFNQLVRDGLNTVVDGVTVFNINSGDEFLPGKVAIGTSYLLLSTPPTDPKFAGYLSGYSKNADTTLDYTNKTWGIYYYMSAIYKLKKAGLLNQAISAPTLASLQTKLDWRTFVNPSDYSLINLPTNYYGVAFSIARLRYLMGWESADASKALLQKMIDHYKTFSAYGFSDETDGNGRFDRYSVLLIGEISQRLIETDMVSSPDLSPSDFALLKGWLRESVDLIKPRLNPSGNGFEYGRSLAAYADTAFVEVLSAAEHLDVLTPEEKEIAYAFGTRVAAKYVQFWYDDQIGSLNMWEKGRRTDSYRGIARILGENFSLSHQLMYTNNIWKADGYADRAPIASSTFITYLGTLARTTFTWFAKAVSWSGGTYDRALATYRDGFRVIGLPMVNGDATYHRNNQYFAIPYSYNMLSGVADTTWPQLLPKITMSNNQALIGAAYFKNIQTQNSADGKTMTVTYDMDAMDRVTGSNPIKDTRLTSSTSYVFEPGQITRTDTYTPTGGTQSISKIEMEFGSFSTGVSNAGNVFSYSSGDVTQFSVEGTTTCAAVDVSADVNYQTPTGPLKTTVRCTWPAMTLTAPLQIKWVLKYKTPSVAGIGPG